MNFIEIIDRIFINKDKYAEVSDLDKIDSFFIINRKLGKGFPDIAKELNHKNIDKASAIDIWKEHFKDTHKIPKWYWDPKKEEKSKIRKKEIDYSTLKEKYEFNDDDIEYLIKYFPENLEKEMNKLKKFEKS